MKRKNFLALIMLSLLVILLSACVPTRKSSCHNCGKSISGDPVEAGGRSYCSYDCYMNEVLFD